MAHWVKIKYERQHYIVNLDRISAFASSPNGRVTFWLPDSSIPIIVIQQNSPEDYQKIQDYIQAIVENSLLGCWMRLFYDRCEYFINLHQIGSFAYTANGKLTFWIPDSSVPIILTKQNDPESYEKIKDFIFKKTGEILP
ncbi:hypothetical protein [Spirulina sp. 06S082]|uniref:hypothetical protein n=1 Tax=Spirulina sp. 06S082 TaxID=3110248 RepID=UPI002B21F878|nr:hypothetical protein [Spirulina sp. 06S082]MEA5471998.1 hypothetical protein [Spirulina sp. 06S082]